MGSNSALSSVVKPLYRLSFAILPALAAPVFSAEQSKSQDVHVSPAKSDQSGFLVHSVTSPYQLGTTTVRVLLPERLETSRKYRVLYVLPVEAKDGDRYGNGLKTVRDRGLHDRFGMIAVAPTFTDLPWYADHPTDPTIRHESYLLKVAVPFIDRTYPALAEPKGRLLVGFSKSGWGAFSLLLRNPETFGAAAAWDAPIMLDAPKRFRSGPIFGTQANFDEYHIPTLLKQRAELLKKTHRLTLLGYGAFREQHREAHDLMNELDIPHTYRDGPERTHRWESGWLDEAVELLAAPAQQQP
jgi:hypothetical protein